MNPMTAKKTIQRLKRRYPNAKPSARALGVRGLDYCVTGALGRGQLSIWRRMWSIFTGYPAQSAARFPLPHIIKETLRKYNPQLTHGRALSFAFAIMAANDAGRIDKAWNIAEEALAWDPTVEVLSSAEPDGEEVM